MQLELRNQKRLLVDFANVKSDTADTSDKRCNLVDEFEGITKFDVVMFTHAHEDHIKGAADFFRMNYSRKSDTGVEIGELWLSASFVADADCTCEDARVIRQEARSRIKTGEGVKIFGYSNELKDWLKKSSIDEDSIKHLIFRAGQLIAHDLGNEVSFFLHAPFSVDCDDVTDKNDPSVVMQMRLHNYERETNVLVIGDVPCDVLDEIVSRSENNNNLDYLKWDLYDVPHHCSTTGLCNSPNEGVEPTDNIKWLLQQSNPNAYMIASCKTLKDADTPPPSEDAANAYKSYSKGDVTFRITMEWPKSSAPEPMSFTIDSRGLRPKSSSGNAFISSPAPRAGDV